MKNISLDITPIRRFTFHYVSINWISATCESKKPSSFTSHYVSINSNIHIKKSPQHIPNLHPTMYLLIQSEVIRIIIFNSNLHPTMYLLIPLISCTNINTFVNHLHPTMYLLIPAYKLAYKDTTNLLDWWF